MTYELGPLLADKLLISRGDFPASTEAGLF
jgi:hypothetical protein